MTTFDDRKDAQENKYKHDEEIRFKIRNRRNKLFGAWIASELLGKEGEAVADYAKDVVMADFDEPGDDDVFKKVENDLAEASVSMSREDLTEKLNGFEGEAERQVMAE